MNRNNFHAKKHIHRPIKGLSINVVRCNIKSPISDVPLVSLSLIDSPGNAETVEVSEADGAEVRMRCEVDANPAAHAVKWFKDVSRTQ